MYTQPSTREQLLYYSRHGGKRAKYNAAMLVILAVWGLVATIGLHKLLCSIAPALRDWAFSGWAACAAVVMFCHTLIYELSQTYWFDRYDDKDGDGNTADVGDSSPWVPLLLTVALVAMDYYGARTYLFESIEKPVRVDRSVIDNGKTAALDRELADYNQAKADIGSRYDLKRNAERERAGKDIANLRKRPTISDNDVAYLNSKIRAAEKQRDANLAKLDQQQADDLAAAEKEYREAKADARTAAEKSHARADTLEASETARVQSEEAEAKTYSWVLSLALALFFHLFMHSRVRISAKSGIFPIRHYTALHAHGGFLEKFWNYVVVDLWERASHALLVWLHNIGAIRELHDFDGRIIEHQAVPEQVAAPQQQKKAVPPQPIAQTPPPPTGLPSSIPTPPHVVAVAPPIHQIPAPDAGGIPLTVIPAAVRTQQSPTVELSPQRSIFSQIPGESQEMVLALIRDWKEYRSTGDTDLYWKCFDARRILLDHHQVATEIREGKVLIDHPISIPFPEMMKRAPFPEDCDTAENTVTQQKSTNAEPTMREGKVSAEGKQESEQDVTDGWFTSVLTEIQREPGNFDNQQADKSRVAKRLSEAIEKMEDGLKKGRLPSEKLRKKALKYIVKIAAPALESAGFGLPSDRLIHLNALLGEKQVVQRTLN